jgi:hypothetical protein
VGGLDGDVVALGDIDAGADVPLVSVAYVDATAEGNCIDEFLSATFSFQVEGSL